jgi:type IV pilus assembly protein PilO
MKLPELSLEPLFEKIGSLTRKQRILICIAFYLLPVLAWGYLSAYPRYTHNAQLRDELEQLEKQVEAAQVLAKQHGRFKKEMAEAEDEFRLARAALPDKQEIPSLLTGITRAGHQVGLEFLLFEPKSEISKDFYAEIPVSITVTGDYHRVAMFFDHVSNLSRIVNIRDIKMLPQKDSTRLTTTCTAVTYKFVEEKPQPAKKADKAKKSGGAS